jgi:hypothetical protein
MTYLINIPHSIYNYLGNLTNNNETYRTIDIFI